MKDDYPLETPSVFPAIVGSSTIFKCLTSVGCPAVDLEARPLLNAQQVLDAQPSSWKLDPSWMPSKCWMPNRCVGRSTIIERPGSVGCPTVALEDRPSSNVQQVLDAQPSRWKLDPNQMPSKCWMPNRRVGSSILVEYPPSVGCPVIALEARPSSNAQQVLDAQLSRWKLNPS